MSVYWKSLGAVSADYSNRQFILVHLDAILHLPPQKAEEGDWGKKKVRFRFSFIFALPFFFKDLLETNTQKKYRTI